MTPQLDHSLPGAGEIENQSEKQFTDITQELECPLEEIEFLFHEIRTPLTAIIGYAEILKNQELSEQQPSILNTIIKEGEHIDALLNDFLDYCQHKSGAWLTDANFTSIHIDDILHEAVTRFSVKPGSHKIQIEVPCDLPPIQGDREKLYLVIRNLLANAIKYSQHANEIIVSVTEDSKNLTITVRDQGIGISEESLPNIFDQGVRDSRAREKSLRGSGFGLAIVKRIVDGHNGQISVESQPGVGSLFRLSLPKT